MWQIGDRARLVKENDEGAHRPEHLRETDALHEYLQIGDVFTVWRLDEKWNDDPENPGLRYQTHDRSEFGQTISANLCEKVGDQ